MGLLEKNVSTPRLRFFLPKDLFGGNLLLSEMTLVRVVLVKMSPPFLTSHCPEVFCEEEVFGISIDDLFANEATRGNFVFCEKTSPPFLARCCPRRALFLSLLGKLKDVCRGLGWEKRLPPFWYPSFDTSLVILG